MSKKPGTLTIHLPDGPISTEAAYQLMLDELRAGVDLTTVRADELLLMRIRVGIVEGDLKPEQVKLLFGGCRPGAIDERGNFLGWPKGLHEEVQQMYFRLRRALAEKGPSPS